MAKKLSAYGNASALAGTEKIPAIQGGVNKNATPAQIKTYVLNGLNIGVATVSGGLVDNTDPANPVVSLPGTVVELDGGGKLPAVDGSQLTNLPSTSLPYKLYAIQLKQASALVNPTVTVLVNQLGGAVTWVREGTGFYSITATGLLTDNKTFIPPFIVDSGVGYNNNPRIPIYGGGTNVICGWYHITRWVGGNALQMTCVDVGGAPIDLYDLFVGAVPICIEIKVFP
jgi:hypothetical protein